MSSSALNNSGLGEVQETDGHERTSTLVEAPTDADGLAAVKKEDKPIVSLGGSSAPNQCVQLPKDKRNILVACGVRMQEEPHFPLNLSVDKRLNATNGSSPVYSRPVFIPLNYYHYLTIINDIAAKSGVSFDVWMAGINRFVRQYGIEGARNILTRKPGVTAEQRNCLEKLLKLEEIRAATTRGVAAVLDLSSFGQTISPLKRMENGDVDYMDKILGGVEKLMQGVNSNVIVPFFPEQTQSRGMLAEDAFRKALPKHKRDANYGADHLLYPKTEAVVVRDFIEGGRRYLSPTNGDCVPVDGFSKDVPIAACLKEAACSMWRESEGIGVADAVQANWDVDPTIYGHASHKNSSGTSQPCDVYYSLEHDIDPREKRLPQRIIANPWPNTLLRSITHDGGVMRSQTADVIVRMVNPLLRQFLNVAMRTSPTAEGLLRAKFGRSFDDFEEWRVDGATNNRLIVPQGIDFGDYADLLRGMCESVGACARAELLRSGTITE